MGGVVVDPDTRTEMEGLYVAGEDAGGAHGSNRLGGNGVANSTVFGGIAGAWILLHTPAATFDQLLPWLTLFATALFAYGRQVASRLRLSLGNEHDLGSLVKTSALQFVIAIYGGYYGAGAGIMMLAVLSLLNMTNIHAMNAFKTLLSGAFNGAAVVIFIVRGAVHWPEALTMMAGGIVGGYGGAWLAQRLPTRWVRGFVIFAGVLTTIYFFWRVRGSL